MLFTLAHLWLIFHYKCTLLFSTRIYIYIIIYNWVHPSECLAYLVYIYLKSAKLLVSERSERDTLRSVQSRIEIIVRMSHLYTNELHIFDISTGMSWKYITDSMLVYQDAPLCREWRNEAYLIYILYKIPKLIRKRAKRARHSQVCSIEIEIIVRMSHLPFDP